MHAHMPDLSSMALSRDTAFMMISARESGSSPSTPPPLQDDHQESRLLTAPQLLGATPHPAKIAEMSDAGSWPRSKRSSISSTYSALTDSSTADRLEPSSPSRTSTSSSLSSSTSSLAMTGGRVDPLTRHYPAPPADVDLDEMLARPPGKWTLGHYFRKSRKIQPQPLPRLKESKSRELEEAKKQLLEAKEEMKQFSLRR